MMEYEGNVARRAEPIKAMPELGRLKGAAERLSFLANKVENFNERFHGSSSPDCGETCDKPVDSYRNDIFAVFAQIERLETAVANLDSIG